MKKLLFAFCVMLMLPIGMAGGVRNEASVRVIVNRPASGGHDHLAEPVAYYYPVSKVFTMEFAAEDFEPYTITLSTMLVEQELLVTTPFVQLNVAELEGYTINFDIETDGGDLYWGSFEATASGSTE